jgi:hypothetical protein
VVIDLPFGRCQAGVCRITYVALLTITATSPAVVPIGYALAVGLFFSNGRDYWMPRRIIPFLEFAVFMAASIFLVYWTVAGPE